jgi:hypothetical protein
MGESGDGGIPDDVEDWEWQEERHARSSAGIAGENDVLLRRYRDFRRAADAVVAAWRHRPEVATVTLIGAVGSTPWKEVPRFAPYRRARIALWHECKDLDLAVWLSHLRDLDGLRRAKTRALHGLHEEGQAGVASHQVDIFVLEPGTDRYLGRLCDFNRCPKGKPECLVARCGVDPFLRQHEGFHWRPRSLAADRAVCLFDRATGRLSLAADLSLPPGTDPGVQPPYFK